MSFWRSMLSSLFLSAAIGVALLDDVPVFHRAVVAGSFANASLALLRGRS